MTSTRTFVCVHCKSGSEQNPRLKGKQHYCGKEICRQARKNKWERDKLQNNPCYKSKRKASKRKWYGAYPGDRYQASYRETHPEYVASCREKQRQRNRERATNASAEKIVKTDALISESLSCSGLYMLLPYQTGKQEKIVKTDALIVEIRHNRDFPGIFHPGSP